MVGHFLYMVSVDGFCLGMVGERWCGCVGCVDGIYIWGLRGLVLWVHVWREERMVGWLDLREWMFGAGESV